MIFSYENRHIFCHRCIRKIINSLPLRRKNFPPPRTFEKPDCSDLSDKLQGSYVSNSATYVQQLIPPPENKGSGRIVYINVTIKSFPNIDSTNLQFTADFYLFLRWFDPRLTFKNIVSRLNQGHMHM
jgi:hypothetical protein